MFDPSISTINRKLYGMYRRQSMDAEPESPEVAYMITNCESYYSLVSYAERVYNIVIITIIIIIIIIIVSFCCSIMF